MAQAAPGGASRNEPGICVPKSRFSQDYNSLNRNRIRQSKEIESIQMSRVVNAPKATYKIVPEEDLYTKNLKQEIKILSAAERPESSRPRKTPTSRRVQIQYDRNGRFVPHEPYHSLTAAELKSVQNRLNEISTGFDSTVVSSSQIETNAKDLLQIYENLSHDVIGKLVEDSSSRCEFAGQLFSTAWTIVSKIVCKLLDMTRIANEQSKDLMRKSINQMRELTDKVDDLTHKPPVVIEKEVIIEKIIEKKSDDKIVKESIELAYGHNARIEEDLRKAQASKAMWQTAAIDLCRLSAPVTRSLFDKQKEWTRLGHSFIDQCKLQVSDLMKSASAISDKWNNECIQIYTLAYKAQASVLMHMSLIRDKCTEISRALLDGFSLYHHSGTTPEKYHESLVGGPLPDISASLQAWTTVISQWIDLDTNPMVTEARIHSSELEEEYRLLTTAVENFPCKQLLPKDCDDSIARMRDRMESLLHKVTKPCDETTLLLLRPISQMFKEWGILTRDALDGKTNSITTSSGFIDPVAMRSLAQKLDAASSTLTKFYKSKSDVIKELQLSVPQFTFDIREMCESLASDSSSILNMTAEMLDENVEIATVWSFMYGAGVQGPFKSVQNRVVDSDFEFVFTRRFRDWMDVLRQNFDKMLHENAFDDFQLLLKDWFLASRELISKKSRFYYNMETQADLGPSMSHSDSVVALSECDSSSSFLPLLTRFDTFMDAPLLRLSEEPIIVCDIPPIFGDDNSAKARAENFAKTQPVLSNMNRNVQEIKDTGRHKTATWLFPIITEFYDFRLQSMLRLDHGSSAIFHNSQSTSASLVSFAKMKYGVKKMIKQFDNDLDSTLLKMKDSDPAVFCLYQFKTGEWSHHCLDFYLMCRERLPKSVTSEVPALVEALFAPFGESCVSTALSCLSLYSPKNRDELLCCLASTFNSILCGRRCESVSLFRRYGTQGKVTLEQFNKAFADVNAFGNPCDVAKICGMFQKNGVIELTFDEFEACLFYNGMFSELNIALKNNPFDLLKGDAFDRIKESIQSGTREHAIQDTLSAVTNLIDQVSLPDKDADSVISIFLRAAQIAYRNKPKEPEPSMKAKTAKVSQPKSPGNLVPRRTRLRSELTARIRTLSQLVRNEDRPRESTVKIEQRK